MLIVLYSFNLGKYAYVYLYVLLFSTRIVKYILNVYTVILW
jgi:hypothetical protein